MIGKTNIKETISSTALIDPSVKLGKDVYVGPYTIIEKDVEIGESAVIDCVINKNGPSIREIIIKNYRQKERLDEIINTATWSLTRMLENSAK